MSDDEPMHHEVETTNASALALSMLLDQTAKGLQEMDGTETRRYSLELTIEEVGDE